MNTRNTVFQLLWMFILSIIFVSGCVSTSQSQLNNTGCDDQSLNSIRSRIETLFEMQPDDYQLTRVECSNIGNKFSVEGLIDGAYHFEYFYYFSTSPSPSQYNEVCFSVDPYENNKYFEIARRNTCSILESKNFCPAWNTSCGIEEYDNSTEVQASCLSGEFDTTQGAKRVFSVRQDTSYSWYAAISKQTSFQECQ